MMSKLCSIAIALTLGAPALLLAQYPGQYPPGQYPPGQYPPGQNPGTGGIGIPSRGHKNKQAQKNAEANAVTLEADGKTVSNDGKTLVVATEDGRTLTLQLSASTTFTHSGANLPSSAIVPRTTVHVRAAEDDQAFLTAMQVELLKEAPPESETPGSTSAPARPAEEDLARPTLMQTPDAPGRPILRHGAPKSAESDSDDTTAAANSSGKTGVPAPPAPQKDSTDFTIDNSSPKPGAATPASDELISRAREWAASFMQGLPNYICEQDTTRYMEQSRASGWQAQDVITAKVLYEDGHEQYRAITVGGKKTNKSMMELGGTTSTGEFNGILQGMFAPWTQTQFKFYRSDTTGESPSAIYDFKVTLPHSDWSITVGGQTLHPAYSGSVWIDRASAHVKRIEKQADNIPKDFPFDEIQTAVDYGEVRLGTATYLLPVHAEVLSCQRGSTICSRNTIDFRDYHKYSSESTITFDK